MLLPVFHQLLTPYRLPEERIHHLWDEISTQHSHKNRHYHTLFNLEQIYEQLLLVRPLILQWDSLIFSLFYHDIVYKATSSQNEENSAALAGKRMNEIGVAPEIISHCQATILETKSHSQHTDSDINYFTDADLSILGVERERYHQYCQQVRKEYAIYPSFLYNRGRKKVIRHFLEMESLFKTTEFQERYNAAARANLAWELEYLS